ncbi:LysR family transcriptional regulator [Gluconacetobacter sacchari]|uniref:LysR family transcriptional regulator n=2 Tax=Gluconacetobacter sacchari TaxID=92759 RepID=A0A7W4IGA9_9PROT|nr:LysR family transcriptional regulator [Gluconacetobacter sacchari]MBB2162346.1 LysR family transcriptional regulator [Gluconacetobacter sacchari]GBQ21367.1 hypothetical protein AA12717_0863 [Gluconacetobacter sacchari DSM 12717]
MVSRDGGIQRPAGRVIGCLPEHIAQPDVENGQLWRLPPKAGVADADIRLIWNEAAQYSRAEQTFIDEMNKFFS